MPVKRHQVINCGLRWINKGYANCSRSKEVLNIVNRINLSWYTKTSNTRLSNLSSVPKSGRYLNCTIKPIHFHTAKTCMDTSLTRSSNIWMRLSERLVVIDLLSLLLNSLMTPLWQWRQKQTQPDRVFIRFFFCNLCKESNKQEWINSPPLRECRWGVGCKIWWLRERHSTFETKY